MRELKYYGINKWNRPVFKEIGNKKYFGAFSLLFNYNESDNEILRCTKIQDLCYFGTRFDNKPIERDTLSPKNFKINYLKSFKKNIKNIIYYYCEDMNFPTSKFLYYGTN